MYAKEMKNSFFADYGKESRAKDRADADITEVKNALKKHIYRAQVRLGTLKMLYNSPSFSSMLEIDERTHTKLHMHECD